MIRALLAGTKTQTRRAIKPQPTVHPNGAWSWEGRNGGFVGAAGTHVDEGFPESARDWNRIQPGDRLWVREAWRSLANYDDLAPCEMGGEEPIRYEADGAHQTWGYPGISRIGRLRASMHMPRWASRLTLVVRDVRVQRLHDISEDDARAEGAYVAPRSGRVADDYVTMAIGGVWFASARGWYADLWDRINGDGSWAANPWIAAYTFTVHQQNIDAMPASDRR
jgi:hypothetical protein